MTIRLLDPPLHEFLPEGDLEHIVGELTSETGMSEDEVYSRIEKLSEVNPMLGFRGCRSSCLSLKLLNPKFHQTSTFSTCLEYHTTPRHNCVALKSSCST